MSKSYLNKVELKGGEILLFTRPNAKKPIYCSFGTQTSETLQENELTVGIEAADSTLESMVESLVNYFKK